MNIEELKLRALQGDAESQYGLGCAYLEVLASLHKRGKVKERFNTSKAISSINKK